MSGQIESIYYDFPMSADKQNLNTQIVHPRSGGAYLFDAVLQPNSSLKPRGFLILMIAIAAVSGVAGIAFMLLMEPTSLGVAMAVFLPLLLGLATYRIHVLVVKQAAVPLSWTPHQVPLLRLSMRRCVSTRSCRRP